MGVQEQAITAVIMNIERLIYSASKGIDNTASTVIGHQIGKGNLSLAKDFYRSFWVVSLSMLTILCIAFTT